VAIGITAPVAPQLAARIGAGADVAGALVRRLVASSRTAIPSSTRRGSTWA